VDDIGSSATTLGSMLCAAQRIVQRPIRRMLVFSVRLFLGISCAGAHILAAQMPKIWPCCIKPAHVTIMT
jgi:hypothetical protein